MDEDKLHQFVGQMLNDLGGAVSVALVRMGDALGLYKSLHQKGPMTVKELAAAVGLNEPTRWDDEVSNESTSSCRLTIDLSMCQRAHFPNWGAARIIETPGTWDSDGNHRT